MKTAALYCGSALVYGLTWMAVLFAGELSSPGILDIFWYLR